MSPQAARERRDPYAQVPHHILSMLCGAGFTDRQRRVLLAIVQEIYRYGDHRLGQPVVVYRNELAAATGLHPTHVSAAISSLAERNILVVKRRHDGPSTFQLGDGVAEPATTPHSQIGYHVVAKSATPPVAESATRLVAGLATHLNKGEQSVKEGVNKTAVLDPQRARGPEFDGSGREGDMASSYQTTTSYLDVPVDWTRMIIPGAKVTRGAFVVYEGWSWEVRLGMDRPRNILRRLHDQLQVEVTSAELAKLPVIRIPRAA